MAVETEGSGASEIETGIALLDEILSAFAAASRFDLTVKARGDLETGDHHTTEDVGITLGSAIGEVIKSGIGSATVPSGQALAQAAVRFGEPGYRGDFKFQCAGIGRHEPGELRPLPENPGLRCQFHPGHQRRWRR